MFCTLPDYIFPVVIFYNKRKGYGIIGHMSAQYTITQWLTVDSILQVSIT